MKAKCTPYCPPDVERILDDFAREEGERLDRLAADRRPSDWQTNPDYYGTQTDWEEMAELMGMTDPDVINGWGHG